jgi:hypothetical protein
MSTIPLDLQRMSELHWAARFRRPAEPTSTPEPQPKVQDQQPAAPSKGKRKTRRLNLAGLSVCTRGVSAELPHPKEKPRLRG